MEWRGAKLKFSWEQQGIRFSEPEGRDVLKELKQTSLVQFRAGTRPRPKARTIRSESRLVVTSWAPECEREHMRMISWTKWWRGLEVDARRSLLSRRERVRPNVEHQEKATFREDGWNKAPSTRRDMVCWLGKRDIHEITGWKPKADDFNNRPSCQARSKVLDMSRETRWVSPCLSSAADQQWYDNQ